VQATSHTCGDRPLRVGLKSLHVCAFVRVQLAAAHHAEEAANKAMYAVARLVAGPASAARAEFYNAGGLSQLQALMASSSGASTRVKTKAINLVSDLIGEE